MVVNQFAFLVVQKPDFGGCHTVGGTVQQTRAELRFQLRHNLGGRGLAYAQLGCGLAEGAQIHHPDKEPDGIQIVHA